MPNIADLVRQFDAGLERLSKRSGIAPDRLEEIAQGRETSLTELRMLAGALKISLSDLVPAPAEHARAAVLFRGLADGKKIPDDTLIETISRRMSYSLELSADRQRPWWTSEFGRGSSYEDAERMAEHFRNLFFDTDQVAPLLSLPQKLVNQLGIFLFVLNTPHLDGASAYLEGVPFIFVAARFGPRMLFTCAHELGHVLAHHDPATDFASVDTHEDVQTQSYVGEERFAHAFASALLLPRAGVGIVLRKVRELGKVAPERPLGDIELLYLARIFGVSFEVAARRCEDLSLLPRGSAASINERLQADYGSAEQRADMAGLPSRAEIIFPQLPDRLLASAVSKIRNGELSIGRASMMLGLAITDLLSANARVQ